MDTPQYKFFVDELEDWEIDRYNTGRPIYEFKPSTPALAECWERIITELKKRGYQQLKQSGMTSVMFAKPEDCMAAYIGTTVNQFSFNEKVWWWYDNFAISKKFIIVHEVYRGNGTDKNVSIRIQVASINTDKKPEWHTNKHHPRTPKNEFGVEIPTEVKYVTTNGNSYRPIEIRKFKTDVSDKVLMKILDKAEEELSKIQLFDPSCWTANPEDFPKSTSKEYKEYQAMKRKMDNK